jgi:hypothetical protein
MKYAVSKVLSGSILLVTLILAASSSHAIVITYVNPGPADGMVHGGFTNIVQVSQPGFYTTTDFLSHGTVISRFDTAIGHGTFPTIESSATAQVEVATDLSNASGTGTRSIVSPITNASFLAARGETYQPGPNGNYSSNTFVHSGNASSASTPTPWIVFVDPEPGEVAGTPVDVTIDASILGSLSVAGSSTADATWNVTTTTHGSVMASTQSLAAAGTSPISDSGTLTFTIPLGTTFELLVHYDLNTAGNGAGANSFSELTASLVEVSAVIAPPVPPMFTTTFLNPLGNTTTSSNPAGPYKKNRTIPVKFELLDEDGLPVSDAVATTLDVRLGAYYDLPGSGGTAVDPGDNPPDNGDSFRYLGDGMFMFNLGTKHADWIADYSYRVVVEVDGATVGQGFFALR